MRRIALLAIGVAFLVASVGAENVLFAPSARSQATQGFESDILDFVVNPELYHLITGTTLVLDLDAQGSGTPLGEVGLRGALALRPGGFFAPHIVVAYDGTGSIGTADPETNIVLDYLNYDLATGTYGTIDETVTALEITSATSVQNLSGLFGLPLGENAGIALEGAWIHNRYGAVLQDYTNSYSDTASPSDSTLTSKGNLTDTEINLLGDADNAVSIEIEFGLAPGVFGATGSLGVSLANLIGTADVWRETVHTYSGGFDPVAEDGSTVTENLGAYYWDGSAAQPRFGMGSDTVDHAAAIWVGLDTLSTIPGGGDWSLEVPLAANLGLYPPQTATDRVTVITLNEATGTEATRDITSTLTVLDAPLDLSVNTGARVRGVLRPAPNATLYLGAALLPNLHTYSHTITRSATDRTQIDGDGDGDYTEAGVDTDTTYTETGYGRSYAMTNIGATVELPIAVSWSPIPALTFHAGTTTSFDFGVTSESSLVTGDTAFRNEQFTDNLVAANSYDERQKDGSYNENTPDISVAVDYQFNVAGNFGFTLVLAPGLTVGALAETQGLAFNRFSLTLSYVPGAGPAPAAATGSAP